jgi:transposase
MMADMRLDLEHQACPFCGGELHVIGETVSEMLDHVPARLRVIRICRPRYGCRACGTIRQAPALGRGGDHGDLAKWPPVATLSRCEP